MQIVFPYTVKDTYGGLSRVFSKEAGAEEYAKLQKDHDVVIWFETSAHSFYSKGVCLWKRANNDSK